MKKIKLFAIFVAFAVFFVGCGKKEKQSPIRYDISVGVTNLDPQFCDSDTGKLILLNCYEGLLRQTNDGSIENLACESYEVSSDKKTYTFTLKDSLKWSDDEKKDFVNQDVTADDFVFAFERIFDSSYPSPFAQKFLKIKNSAAVLEGKLTKDKLVV
ncbi:MAG: ABC transporter substrate-binding protein, partial [Oscillospiraceae bacterium]